MIKILVADDDKNLRKVLVSELSTEDWGVTDRENGAKALELLEKEEYDVLLLDLNMPGLSGMDVLKKIGSLQIPVEIIVLTAHGTVTTAVEAMKLGAYDFLTKPFKMEELRAIIDKAYEKKKLRRENLLLKTQLKQQVRPQGIVTRNPLMEEILETVRKVATSDLPVLVYGESGVGKELIARAVHDASPRAEKPFIPLNCGAIPETMLESELFGHEKGAFTGASDRKIGMLEVADGGTVFLDEVGELPLPLQVKLLRVIETRRFFRVGGVKEVSVDIKFVSATNKDLKAAAEDGKFRADLYYRISALALHIPPLRERQGDIPLLVEHYLKQQPSFKTKKFSPAALAALSRYPWPGNVRELQNMVHRILLLTSHDVIDECDLPPDLTECKKVRKTATRLADIERTHVLEVLRDAGGHRGRAAEALGIDPKTLYRKLLEYGVKE
jgi:DNA-binding NtrC family response regulator